MLKVLKVDPPCVFLIAAGGGSEIFAGGSTPNPPVKYSPGCNYTYVSTVCGQRTFSPFYLKADTLVQYVCSLFCIRLYTVSMWTLSIVWSAAIALMLSSPRCTADQMIDFHAEKRAQGPFDVSVTPVRCII